MAPARYTVMAAALKGVEATPVDVEISISTGIPGFFIVGMVDAAVQESKERVRAAIKAAGFTMPSDRVLVNLAPSSLKKTGSGYDLAIAMGILVLTGQIDPDVARHRLFVGELSLTGEVRPVAGLLAYGLCARDYGYTLVCAENADSLTPVEDLRVMGLRSLQNLREDGFVPVSYNEITSNEQMEDYADVSGNEIAKRAFQIAAAGNHGILMMGPPGSGKSMLATRMPSILPPLTEEEKIRVALTHSVAGEDLSSILVGRRPFRCPHHSATAPGLLGGGNPIRPGEISLADGGVLFLDELAEFKSSVLQQIRQPLENGRVVISRADGAVEFPARFMLVAASNPCPCGFFGDPERECLCTVPQVRKYQNRIGGPLIDRIDLQIDVRRVPPQDVISSSGGTSSQKLREGVMSAREFALWRMQRHGIPKKPRELIASCNLSDDDTHYLEDVARMSHMSGRGIVRTASVARTIADLDNSEIVSHDHLCEALSFRIREGIGQ